MNKPPTAYRNNSWKTSPNKSPVSFVTMNCINGAGKCTMMPSSVWLTDSGRKWKRWHDRHLFSQLWCQTEIFASRLNTRSRSSHVRPHEPPSQHVRDTWGTQSLTWYADERECKQWLRTVTLRQQREPVILRILSHQVTVQAFRYASASFRFSKWRWINNKLTVLKKEHKAISYTRPSLSLKDEFTPKCTSYTSGASQQNSILLNNLSRWVGGLFDVPRKPLDPKLTFKDFIYTLLKAKMFKVAVKLKVPAHTLSEVNPQAQLCIKRVNNVFSNELRVL